MAPPDSNQDSPHEPDKPVEELLDEELSPSQLLVLKTLTYEGWLSTDELTQETRLSKQTVKYALGALNDHSLIKDRSGASDGRKKKYTVNGEVDFPPQFCPPTNQTQPRESQSESVE